MRNCFALILMLFSVARLGGQVMTQPQFAELSRIARIGDAKAIQQVNELANSGDKRAQALLGLMYHIGEGVSIDVNVATQWYQRAYQHGATDVAYLLGSIYEDGDGVPKDLNTAFRWYRLAADGDDNPLIKFHIAAMYEHGDGTPKDISAAIQWYSLAAKQNLPCAQSSLGNLYENGAGTVKDFSAAVNLYRQAADQGDVGGMLGLGSMYRFGKGLPKDLVTAYMWLNLAASRDYESVSKVRDSLESQMTREQIAEAQKLSREWKPKTVAKQ